MICFHLSQCLLLAWFRLFLITFKISFWVSFPKSYCQVFYYIHVHCMEVVRVFEKQGTFYQGPSLLSIPWAIQRTLGINKDKKSTLYSFLSRTHTWESDTSKSSQNLTKPQQNTPCNFCMISVFRVLENPSSNSDFIHLQIGLHSSQETTWLRARN